MKKKILILLSILGLAIYTSCNSDDDSVQPEILNGTWNLINASGGIAGVNESYQNGSVTWTFDSQNSTVTIENNSQATVYTLSTNGTYSYTIVESEDKQYLHINDVEIGRYVLSTNTLIVNENEIASGSRADAFVLQFQR